MATNDDEEEHDDGEEHDIFQSIDIIEDEQENDQGDYKVASPLHHEEEIKYQNRKPKWWGRVAGRRGSKAQRRAYRSMESHKLASISYGELYDFQELFCSKEIWLEIGSGQGHVLLANSERHTDAVMIGADIHKAGVGLTLLRIEAAINSSEYWRDYSIYSTTKDPFTEKATGEDDDEVFPPPTPDKQVYSNVRVFPGDGMKLLRSISTSSLSVTLMTFPDPWDEAGEKQFRLLQNHTLEDFHRILKPGGRFFLATDHIVFYKWSLELFAASPQQFRKVEPCPPRAAWLPVISKYEQKGWDEGRRTNLVCWETIKSE
jgi:tRNA G46 methylase TrmB